MNFDRFVKKAIFKKGEIVRGASSSPSHDSRYDSLSEICDSILLSLGNELRTSPDEISANAKASLLSAVMLALNRLSSQNDQEMVPLRKYYDLLEQVALSRRECLEFLQSAKYSEILRYLDCVVADRKSEDRFDPDEVIRACLTHD